MTTLIGVNTSVTDTALTDGTTFNLGARHQDHNGNVWVFVKASAALALGDCGIIRESGRATGLTLANSKTIASRSVGFAQVAVAADSYAWLQVHGSVASVRVKIDCEPYVALYPTSTAGSLDDATVSTMVQGVAIVTSATAAGAFSGVAHFPQISRGANLSQI